MADQAVPVSPRSRWIGRLVIGAVLLGSLAYLGLAATSHQLLLRARLGIAGTLDSRLDAPVTVTASLPSGIGLTPSERRQGWPELNKPQEQRVALREEFGVEFSRISYCVTRFVWQPLPAPPAAFYLRFSDAPSEEYLVTTSGYLVRSQGTAVPAERASWKLEVGALERTPQDGRREPHWLLHIRFKPQASTAERKGSVAQAPSPPRGRRMVSSDGTGSRSPGRHDTCSRP